MNSGKKDRQWIDTFENNKELVHLFEQDNSAMNALKKKAPKLKSEMKSPSNKNWK